MRRRLGRARSAGAFAVVTVAAAALVVVDALTWAWGHAIESYDWDALLRQCVAEDLARRGGRSSEGGRP